MIWRIHSAPAPLKTPPRTTAVAPAGVVRAAAHLGVGGGEDDEQGDGHEGQDAGRQTCLGALGLLLGGDRVARPQRGRGSFEGYRRRPPEAGTRAQHGERQTGGTCRVDVGGIQGHHQ